MEIHDFLNTTTDILSKQKMSNKEFDKYFVTGLGRVQPYKFRKGDKAIVQAYADRTFTLLDANETMMTKLEPYIFGIFGRAVAAVILPFCCSNVCHRRVWAYWQYILTYMMYVAPLADIKWGLYVCAKLILAQQDYDMREVNRSVMVRLTSMLISKYEELAPYCAKIGIVKLLRCTDKYAIYAHVLQESLSVKVPLAGMTSCAACGKINTTKCHKKCARCKTVRYCDVECQKTHWKVHKCECT
jgi:hypothetical protein